MSSWIFCSVLWIQHKWNKEKLEFVSAGFSTFHSMILVLQSAWFKWDPHVSTAGLSWSHPILHVGMVDVAVTPMVQKPKRRSLGFCHEDSWRFMKAVKSRNCLSIFNQSMPGGDFAGFPCKTTGPRLRVHHWTVAPFRATFAGSNCCHGPTAPRKWTNGFPKKWMGFGEDVLLKSSKIRLNIKSWHSFG